MTLYSMDNVSTGSCVPFRTFIPFQYILAGQYSLSFALEGHYRRTLYTFGASRARRVQAESVA